MQQEGRKRDRYQLKRGPSRQEDEGDHDLRGGGSDMPDEGYPCFIQLDSKIPPSKPARTSQFGLQLYRNNTRRVCYFFSPL